MPVGDLELFRLRAFEAVWVDHLLTLRCSEGLIALLVREASHWIAIGQEAQCFSHSPPHIDLRRPLSTAFEPFFSAVSTATPVDPVRFAEQLSDAQDDLTRDRLAFLDAVIFDDDVTWDTRLSATRAIVEAISVPMPSEQADLLSWLLTGQESFIDSDEQLPAYWRSSDASVLNTVRSTRLAEVTAISELIAARIDAGRKTDDASWSLGEELPSTAASNEAAFRWAAEDEFVRDIAGELEYGATTLAIHSEDLSPSTGEEEMDQTRVLVGKVNVCACSSNEWI